MGQLTELSNGFDFAQKAKLTSDGAHDNVCANACVPNMRQTSYSELMTMWMQATYISHPTCHACPHLCYLVRCNQKHLREMIPYAH